MILALASNSKTRQKMLNNANVPFQVVPARLDEEMVRDGLRAEGIKAYDLADALAQAKAIRGASRVHHKEWKDIKWVLGADQTLEYGDGLMLDKPKDKEEAIHHLHLLSGKPHRLYSAAVLVKDGEPKWRHIDKVQLEMRDLSPAFIRKYVEREWDNIQYSVGGYCIEGAGVQLFKRIRGDFFTILGLPLFPLLAHLRQLGVIEN